MQEAIKILEDNFRLSSKDYIKLLGMLQELQQYRDNVHIDKNNQEVEIEIRMV